MRVLLLGGTGNLGSRVIPALLSHGHSIVAYVRSSNKLGHLLPVQLLQLITVVEGDAFDTQAVANALRDHGCDALVNTAGRREPPGKEQTLGKLVDSVTSAAKSVGRSRGKPLRAWIIGGQGSLRVPKSTHQIQDYLPAFMTEHHRGTEHVIETIPTHDLEWSLLCVAMMEAESREIKKLSAPRGHNLLVQSATPPGWQDDLIKDQPVDGIWLDFPRFIGNYTAKYEDVADLIAEDLSKDDSEYTGKFVGYKAS